MRRSGLAVDTTGVAPGRVRGDAPRSRQVVRNLVDNAARHATRPSRSLSARPATASARPSTTTVPAIPADERERVFERFVRLDEARARDAGGSGLGLAIVEEIVQRPRRDRHRLVRAGLGGARFVVRLPPAPDVLH